MTTIIFNGESRDLEPGATVADAVSSLPITRGLAVARNGEIVPRSAWEITRLEASDHLEVLSVAQGG